MASQTRTLRRRRCPCSCVCACVCFLMCNRLRDSKNGTACTFIHAGNMSLILHLCQHYNCRNCFAWKLVSTLPPCLFKPIPTHFCCFVLFFFFIVHYKICFHPPPAGAAVVLPRLDSSAPQKSIALGLQPVPVVCVPARDWCIKQRLGALCTMKGICASPGHISQQTCKTSKNHNSHFMPLQRFHKLHGVSDKTAGSRGWNKWGEDDTRGKERGREFKRV